MALVARLRFYARQSANMERYDLGSDVTVWAEYRDALTNALTAASGVSFAVTKADGSSADAPAVVTEATGIYRAVITPDQAGIWAVEVSSTTTGATNDRREFAIIPDSMSPSVIGPTAGTSVNGIVGPSPVLTASDITSVYSAASAVERSVQSKFYESASILDFIAAGDRAAAEDGTFDCATALETAAAEMDARGARIIFPAHGLWRFDRTATLTRGNICLDGEGLATITAAAGLDFEQPLIQISGGGITHTTTMTASVARDGREITLTSATGFAPGDLVAIRSDAEYFCGIAETSGFRNTPKSELNVVRSVSGNVVTLEFLLADSYDATTYVVTVERLSTIRNVEIRGLHARGLGGSGATSAGVGPAPFRIDYASNVAFNNCDHDNFPAHWAQAYMCADVRVIGGHGRGRDMSDATNQPDVSPQFGGFIFSGVRGAIFANRTATNMRRPFDAGAFSGSVIPRDIVIANCVSTGCFTGFGCHISSGLTFTGLISRSCGGGIYFRGKDVTIRDCDLDSTDAPGLSTAGIMINGDADPGYTEDCSAGHIDISDCRLRGAVNYVFVRSQFDSLSIANVKGYGGAGHAVWVRGKGIAKMRVTNCDFDTPGRTGTKYGVYFDAIHTRSAVSMVEVTDNVFRNTAEIVYFEGSDSSATPADQIWIARNKHLSDIGDVARGVRLVSGYFGDHVFIRDNDFLANYTLGDPIGIDSDNRHYYRSLPKTRANYSAGIWQDEVIRPQSSSTVLGQIAIFAGQRIRNSAPTAAGNAEWVVVSSGSGGTLSARTGAIASGSATLTLSTNSDNAVAVGNYIRVIGAGVAAAQLEARVLAVSGAGNVTITLDTAASTTVTVATVGYLAPVIKSANTIAA